MSPVNKPSGLTDTQMEIIRKCTLEKRDFDTTWHRIRNTKPAMTKKLVREMMEVYSAQLSARSTAKQEGAEMVEQYLNNVRDGVDVDDMTTLLEQALYRDILRRYSQLDDPLVGMTMEQVLKIDIAYRGSRLSRLKYEKDTNKTTPQLDKFSANLISETLDQVKLQANGTLDKDIDEIRELVMEWAGNTYGKTTIEEVENDRNEIEQLRQLQKQHSTNGNSESRSGYGKSVGLAE